MGRIGRWVVVGEEGAGGEGEVGEGIRVDEGSRRRS